MRIILFTGKGGVGKTTIAAATALRASELGYRTVAISTDAAHSLADSLDIQLGPEAQQVAPNLWGQETEMSHTFQKHWGTIHDWLVALMAWRGVSEVLADEMAVLPGMEELANLLYIMSYYDKKEHDVVVVDCAPTGETLRLLSFPEMLRWWMEKLFPIERKAVSLLRPLVKPLNIPMPSEEVFNSMQRLYSELERMRILLTNPEISTVRLVVNPEKMVIKEAQRTYTYLNLYGYHTDLIVCNRVFSNSVDGRFFEVWKESQGKNYQILEECFAPIPILPVPFMDREVVGLPMLGKIAKALYEDRDPTAVMFQGKAHSIEDLDGSYVLSLMLPFISREQISLTKTGNELIIQVGSYRRNIILPHALEALPVQGAKFEGNTLKITFKKV